MVVKIHKENGVYKHLPFLCNLMFIWTNLTPWTVGLCPRRREHKKGGSVLLVAVIFDVLNFLGYVDISEVVVYFVESYIEE